jgi:hypothetical protein
MQSHQHLDRDGAGLVRMIWATIAAACVLGLVMTIMFHVQPAANAELHGSLAEETSARPSTAPDSAAYLHAPPGDPSVPPADKAFQSSSPMVDEPPIATF